MGCIKKLKPAIKQIREELTREVMQGAARVIAGLGEKVADGRLSKTEAREVAADALQLVYQLRRAAAEAAVTIAVRAAELGTGAADLDDDDSGSEPLAI